MDAIPTPETIPGSEDPVPDYAFIGGLRIDYLITPDGRTADGVFGGNAAFAAVGARLWTQPGQTAIIAKSGAAFPQAWLAALEGHGISTECVIHLDEPVEQRTFFVHLTGEERDESQPQEHYRRLGLPLPQGLRGYVQASSHADEEIYRPLRLAPQEIPDRCWPRRVLHFSPTDWVTMSACLPRAQAARIPQISVDPGLWARLQPLEKIRELIRRCHVFLPSEMEARWMLGEALSPQELVRELARLGPGTVVLKAGKEGVLVYQRQGERLVHVPAFPTQVVDVTGAGDAFCGGFAVGLAQSGDPVEAACYGTVSASFVVEGFGALHALEASTPRAIQERLAWVRSRVEERG